MFLTGVDIEDLEDAGIVYNLPKKLMNIGIDFNMINTLNEKELHYSHTKAYHIIKESYPYLIRQFVPFIDSDEKVQERSNSDLNLTLVEWSNKKTRYQNKTQLKTKQKSFNLANKKNYSTLSPCHSKNYSNLGYTRGCFTKFCKYTIKFSNKFRSYSTKPESDIDLLKLDEEKPVIDRSYNFNYIDCDSHLNTNASFKNNILDQIIYKRIDEVSIKIAMQNFAKAAVNRKLYGVIFYDYNTIRMFLKNFKSSFQVSKQSLSNYKKRKLVFKSFMLTEEIISFFYYVKKFFPYFDEKAFLSLSKVIGPKNIKHTRVSGRDCY